jgi:LacI family transcriptional regulator
MPKNQNRAVTMTDVARAAGVSQTTVSLIINQVATANISDATRQRVWDTIRELGYRPNAAARKMRTNQSHFIGFITDEIATTPHAGLIVKGAQDAAWENHKIILLVNTNGNQEMEGDAVEVMLEHQVEGIIYAAMYHHCVQPPKALHEAPTVLLNCFSEMRDFPSVASDEVLGGFTATEYLIQKGRRRIAFANYTGPTPGSVGRLEGYHKALEQYGIAYDPDLVCHASGEADGGYDCTMRLFSQKNLPDALFCFNDRMAMGAYDALRKKNLSIPEDVAVVGFDNQEIIAAHLYPGLTTLQLPHYEMGRWAVSYLLSIIDKPESKKNLQHQLPCPVVVRDSA